MIKIRILVLIICLLPFFPAMVHAIDSEETRETIQGVRSVAVFVEEPQPNIRKYAAKFGLTREQVRKDVEQKLVKSGISVLSDDKWLKTQGRPLLYININTHEYEKYWYAYDIRVSLRQLVTLEARPAVKTLASTWAVNVTGVANIGTLNVVKKDLDALVGRYIEAANRTDIKSKEAERR